MRKRNIVIGQRVDLDKVKRARMLRGQMTEEEGILWERLRAKRCSEWYRDPTEEMFYLPTLLGARSPLPVSGRGWGRGHSHGCSAGPNCFASQRTE